MVILQEIRQKIRIYDSEIENFKGTLITYNDLPAFGLNKTVFEITDKNICDSLLNLFKTATKYEISRSTNQYATIRLTGFTEKEIYCFEVYLTMDQWAVFGQDECNTKYFHRHLGEFQNFKIHEFFGNYFLKQGINLDSIREHRSNYSNRNNPGVDILVN